jgi:hypothetical protein
MARECARRRVDDGARLRPRGAERLRPSGGTALHCAAWEACAECVSAILRYPSGRALLDQRDTRYGGTPFNWCCHGSRNSGKAAARFRETARVLIDAGTKVDLETLDVPAEVEEVITGALHERGR